VTDGERLRISSGNGKSQYYGSGGKRSGVYSISKETY
jgi:hypothetical protein